MTVNKKVKKRLFKKEFKNGLEKLFLYENLTFDESKKLEQLYRNETAHFTSGQFQKTFSAGMEKFSDKFPFGWVSLNKYFWSQPNRSQYKPIGFETFTEGLTGKKKTFLKFKSVYDAMLVNLMNARMKGNNFYAWYSNDTNRQNIYKSRLDRIIPRLTKEIFAKHGIKSVDKLNVKY